MTNKIAIGYIAARNAAQALNKDNTIPNKYTFKFTTTVYTDSENIVELQRIITSNVEKTTLQILDSYSQ
jgi:acetylornithine deacetylase/succinyl-diaminopimelate desuccinylase-like protein